MRFLMMILIAACAAGLPAAGTAAAQLRPPARPPVVAARPAPVPQRPAPPPVAAQRPAPVAVTQPKLIPVQNQNLTRPSNSPFSSSAASAKFEVQKADSRQAHNRQANRRLYENIQSDARYAQSLEKQFPGIGSNVTPGEKGGMTGRSPHASVTWHHSEYNPRSKIMTLELVPKAHHQAAGPVQQSLHPFGKGAFRQMQIDLSGSKPKK